MRKILDFLGITSPSTQSWKAGLLEGAVCGVVVAVVLLVFFQH